MEFMFVNCKNDSPTEADRDTTIQQSVDDELDQYEYELYSYLLEHALLLAFIFEIRTIQDLIKFIL